MDISRIERRIKKINSVLDLFKEDNKLSSIEKDLLLGYVRELYELIKESDTDVLDFKTDALLTKLHEKDSVKAEPKIAEEIKKIEPVVIKEVPAIEVISPVVEEKPEVVSTPVVEEKKIVYEVTQDINNNIKESVTLTKSTINISEELESIFVQEEITDISGKLSRTKIDDISKVIGINERLFTINELFGSNGKLFDTIVKKLNSAADFESAKDILINEVALPLNWEKENKLKQAQQFVKHVRRKFN